MSWTITIMPTASPTITAMAAGDMEAVEDLCEAVDKFMK